MIPTKIVQGKLWLFPDSSPQGVEASKHVEPALVPGLDLVGLSLLRSLKLDRSRLRLTVPAQHRRAICSFECCFVLVSLADFGCCLWKRYT